MLDSRRPTRPAETPQAWAKRHSERFPDRWILGLQTTSLQGMVVEPRQDGAHDMAKRDEIRPKERLEGSVHGIMASEVIQEVMATGVSTDEAYAALLRKRSSKSGVRA